MNSTIIPATSSNIGNVLVSIWGVSQQYRYKAVMKRHIDNDIIGWFLSREEYSPLELIQGMKKELRYIDSVEGVQYRCNNNQYPVAIRLAEDIMMERFDFIEYPELWIY